MQLYSLLLGPFLRRTEPSRVCIWLATSIQPDLCEATIYSLTRQKGKKPWGEKEITTNTEYNVIQLGSRLFVILLIITPDKSEGLFKPLNIYGYDIKFQFRGEDKVILNEKDITSEDGGPKSVAFTKTYNTKKQYTYADLPYPVFVIPQQDAPNARILYGSCRKAHGRGSDALNAANKLLEEHWSSYQVNQDRIPDFSLFLLGDQIYADDLNELVFDSIQDLVLSIMGYEEAIPEYVNINEITTNDLTKFLYNYLDGVPGFEIEDLNLPTKISYKGKSIPNFRRENVYIFLEKYFPRLRIRSAPSVYDVIEQRAPDLIDFIRKLPGQNAPLIDVNEIMKREYLKTKFSTRQIKVKDIKYKDRRDFLRRNSSISTDDQGHLLSLGEYAALYLLNWGNFFLLRNDFDTQVKMSTVSEHFGTAVPDEYKDNLEGLLDDGNVQIRRLFANVPTYMIFDDHDVTDDWNLDEGWRNAIERSITGKRLVSNALAAYWAFQGWGNNPDAYQLDFINSIREHLKILLDTKGSDDPSKAKIFEDTLWKFQDWAFIAPTNPISVFLDNRTLRGPSEEMNYFPELNKNKQYKAARLMNQVAFDKIEGLLSSVKYKRNTPIIFCAPTPIIGSPLFEKGQLLMIDGSFNSDTAIVKIAKRFKEPGRYSNDYECWSANPRGKYEFFNFLDSEVQPSKIIILSGDVHYGFHASVSLYSRETNAYYDIEQFTSSAFKNNTMDKLQDINLLAYLSTYDTKDKEYKEINETYPFPKKYFATGAPVPHFLLRGRFGGNIAFRRYSNIMDDDSWLIFHNNVGVLNAFEQNNKFSVVNLFLFSESRVHMIKSFPI